MAWTVDGTDVGALEDGSYSPDFNQRDTQATTLTWQGTGINETHVTAYGPYAVSLQVWFTDAAKKTTLENKRGTLVTVVNTLTAESWTATLLQARIRAIAGGAGGYGGTLELVRSGAS